MTIRSALLSVCGLALALAAHRRPALRILRFSRVVADLERSEAFYRDALGLTAQGRGPCDPALAALFGVPAGTGSESVMRLGAEEIALVHFGPHGAPYPAGSRSDDLWFQHLAIAVSDMDAAYGRLMALAPQPISTAGPEILSAANGGVTAFKFRDPDGHPLELIRFAPRQGRPVWRSRSGGPCLGIDHSAISVGATARSRRFYRSLGFNVASRSFNHGPAQSRLDDLPHARVRVTGLRPRSKEAPGLELLGYDPPGRLAAYNADVNVTGWVTVESTRLPGRVRRAIRDPDGHVVVLAGSCPIVPPPRLARR